MAKQLPALNQAPIAGDHAQLLALVNNMPDGFISLDSAGHVTLSNSVALDLLDANQLNGKQLLSVMDIIDKNGFPIDIQKMVLLTTKAFTNRDWKLRYKDDSSINVQINVSPVHVGYGQAEKGGFVLLIRDITAEKSLEEERDEFISVAGHELRTPVAIAEGSLSNARLMAERDKASDPIKHTIEAAYEQVMFLSNLINDLAMLSRADSGKTAQSVETFGAGEMLTSLVRDYQASAAQKHLALQAHADPQLGLMTTSKLYVREILQNFITNAIKYTEKGGVTISAVPLDGGVQFSVADTGFGIGKNEQAKLFGKFFRSEDWRVRQVTGTGLGLYVTSKLARLIGAKIGMQSELNKGSVFTLFVPNMTKAP